MTGTVPDISIHALREEGDFPPWWLAPPSRSFLSTPSARRATTSCGFVRNKYYISIHALREEGDEDKANSS